MFIVKLFRLDGNVESIPCGTRPEAIERAENEFVEVGGGVDEVLVYDPDAKIIFHETKDTRQPKSSVRWRDGTVVDNVSKKGATIERKRL